MSVSVIETINANLELMSGKSLLHILRDVNLKVNGGEVTAVVGPSGSGKTSLLMILGGLERATSGKVIVAGEDISTANEDELAIFRRKNLGILFQNFHLIHHLFPRVPFYLYPNAFHDLKPVLDQEGAHIYEYDFGRSAAAASTTSS